MAVYNLANYLAKDGFGMSLNIRRGNPNPLDNSAVWPSLTAAQSYAKDDPTAYVGQVLSVVNTATDGTLSVDVYKINNAAGDLVKVGTSPVGDTDTVVVAEDGTISLAGISGLTFTEQNEDGEDVSVNYQPLLTGNGLTWVRPSATTVEGLATEIAGIETRIGTAESDIESLEGAVSGIQESIGSVAEGKTVIQMIEEAQTAATYDDTALAGRVTAAEGEIDTIQGQIANIYNKTETDSAIATAKQEAIDAIIGEAGIDEKYDTLREVADWILTDTTNSTQLITRVDNIEKDYLKGADKTELQNAIDGLEEFIGELPAGAVSTNVISYIQEAIDGIKIGDYAKASDLTALAKRVTDTETKLSGIEEGAQVNVIDNVDETYFSIGDGKTLTLLDIAIGKVTGLSDALTGKVSVVEGSRLMTEAEASKLEKLVMDEDGSVSISGTVAAGNVEGLADWITARAATLEGLSENNLTDTLLEKLNGIADGAQVNVIESVKLNGTLLDIVNKAVNIPLGAGLKSGDEVEIGDDGTLGISKISVEKLYTPDGTEFVLNGGKA